ncbi:MAG: hypothetical protein KC419_14855 [Anaerolineales bacterium]|nr:hypothetical protein [Anaerolineales bacterium]
MNIPIRFYFVLAVLTFLVVGCGSTGSDEASPTLVAAATVPADDSADAVPTATPVPAAPTIAPTDEAPVADDAGNGAPANSPTLALNATNSYGEPINVSSYKLTLEFKETITEADGTEIVTSVLMEGERDVIGNKAVFSAQMLGDVDFGPGNTFTYTEVDDRTYFILPTGQCATFSETATDGDLYSIFLSEGGFIGDLDGASIGNPPTENINGVDTDHYVFNETNLISIDAAADEVNSVEGHVYVAQDGEYIVRVVMDGIGNSSLLDENPTEAAIHYELNYFDFDEPVNITVPDSCTDVAETEYPILEDAFAINAFPGIFSYQSNVDVETAVLFYQTEMANDGWSVSQEFDVPGGKMIGFSKDGENVQITINQEGDSIQVGILAAP